MATQTTNTPDRDAWDAQPTLEQLTSHDIWGLRRAFLERLFPDVRGLRVLELGSGPAHDSLVFAERGAEVTAVDCSRAGLDLAQAIYTGKGLTIRTVQADAADLPFEDGEFDIVFNGGVLEHFTDRQLESVLDQMIRVVRPGGTLLAFCPNRYNVFYQSHLRRVRQHAYDFERAFTAHELRERLRARGLSGVHLSGVHVHPAPNYLLPAWLPKYHLIEPFCRKCFGWFERLDGCHRLKSLIGQDFVAWAQVPRQLEARRALGDLTGGPAVRSPAYRVA